jgi:hypothetical protein
MNIVTLITLMFICLSCSRSRSSSCEAFTTPASVTTAGPRISQRSFVSFKNQASPIRQALRIRIRMAELDEGQQVRMSGIYRLTAGPQWQTPTNSRVSRSLAFWYRPSHDASSSYSADKGPAAKSSRERKA